jgi:hypothetical protein
MSHGPPLKNGLGNEKHETHPSGVVSSWRSYRVPPGVVSGLQTPLI